jgi:hypothetical protein
MRSMILAGTAQAQSVFFTYAQWERLPEWPRATTGHTGNPATPARRLSSGVGFTKPCTITYVR